MLPLLKTWGEKVILTCFTKMIAEQSLVVKYACTMCHNELYYHSVILILRFFCFGVLIRDLNLNLGLFLLVCFLFTLYNTPYYTLQKVTQHEFDRSYFFYPGLVLIKLDIPAWKACLFGF